MPSGGPLGLLFVIYINVLDDNIGNIVSKFAGATNIGGMVE